MDVIFNGSNAPQTGGGWPRLRSFSKTPKLADGTRKLNIDADEVAVGRRLYRDGVERIPGEQPCFKTERHPRTVHGHRRGVAWTLIA